jgi:hypothetical protein
MNIYPRTKVNYRKIYKDFYGEIPKDENSRSFEIPIKMEIATIIQKKISLRYLSKIIMTSTLVKETLVLALRLPLR